MPANRSACHCTMVPTALPNTRTKPRDSTASTVATNDPTACGVAEAPPATWLPEALASVAAEAMPPGGCLLCTAERYAGGGGAAFGGGTANVFASLPGPWCRQTLCAMVQRAVEVSVDAVTLLAPTPGGASGGGFAVNGTWHDHMRTQHSIGKRCKHMLRIAVCRCWAATDCTSQNARDTAAVCSKKFTN